MTYSVISMDTHKTADGSFEFVVTAVGYQVPTVELHRMGGFVSRAIASSRGKLWKRRFKSQPIADVVAAAQA